jgi:hypothetical protein
MSSDDLAFILGFGGTLVAFWVLAALFIWPALRRLSRNEALRILVVPHTFRFIGLSFLIVGVVSPELDSEFTVPAAWGDFGAAILALSSIAALTWRPSFAIPVVWVFSVWGTIDLLNAFVIGAVLQIEPGSYGAAYYIPTTIVPALLVTHAFIFVSLLRSDDARDRQMSGSQWSHATARQQ